MKGSRLLATILLCWGTMTLATDTLYHLRVDGLACPFCAYGIEKKLLHTLGVVAVTFDLEKGIVTVTVKEGMSLTEAALKQLIHDAGFTLRSMTQGLP